MCQSQKRRHGLCVSVLEKEVWPLWVSLRERGVASEMEAWPWCAASKRVGYIEGVASLPVSLLKQAWPLEDEQNS